MACEHSQDLLRLEGRILQVPSSPGLKIVAAVRIKGASVHTASGSFSLFLQRVFGSHFVNGNQLFIVLCSRVSLFVLASGGVAHGAKCFRMIEGPLHLTREVFCIARLEKEAISAMADKVRHRTQIACEYGKARRESLDDRKRCYFVASRRE